MTHTESYGFCVLTAKLEYKEDRPRNSNVLIADYQHTADCRASFTDTLGEVKFR